jgi:protein TonB
MVFAFGIHASVYAMSPRYSGASATDKATQVEVEIFVEPPPPEPPKETEPAALAVMPKPRLDKPVRPRVQAPAPAPAQAEEVPPPPPAEEAAPEPPEPSEPPQTAETAAPAEPAPALVAAPDAAPTEHSIVQSAGGALGGRGVGGAGVVGGTGSGKSGGKGGVVGGTGTGRAQEVELAGNYWDCEWPSLAQYQDIDRELVVIQVLVAADGRVEKVDLLKDPGFGFGAAARACARRARFTPALDENGRPIKALSSPINVRFVR